MRRGRSWFPALGALVLLFIAVLAAGPAAAQDDARQIMAAHILVSPNDDPGGAQTLPLTDPAWAVAEAEADAMAAELGAITDPSARAARFAELAKTRSDDPGSGANGGDLGAFTRDVMVPEFGDPLFDAVDPQVGDVIGPVRSPFGWHLILYQGEAGPLPSPSPDPAATPAPTPGTTLVDPGAEPRAVLRYAPAEGSTATVTMSATSDQTIAIAGMDSVRSASTLTMVWDAVVDAVNADGTTHTTMTLTDVTVDDVVGLPTDAEQGMRDQMAGMVGLVGWTLSDSTGAVIDSGADLPEGIDPTIGRVFEQLLSGFAQAPAALVTDAVGVGAHWAPVVVVPPTDLSTTVTSWGDTTLTALDGTTVTTHTTGISDVAPGPITYPGLPADAIVSLRGGSGSTEATTTMDLASLQMHSTIHSESTAEMEITTGGQTFQMTTDTIYDATITAE